MCTTYGIGLMTTAGPAGFGNPEIDGIVAFPASHFGHSRYSQQQREELNRMFSLVKELSARFSRFSEMPSEELVAWHIRNNPGLGTTNPDVGQTLSNNINDGSYPNQFPRWSTVSNHLRSTTDPMDGITCVEDNLASILHFFNGLEDIISLDDPLNNQFPDDTPILDLSFPDSLLMSDIEPSWMGGMNTLPREGDDDTERGKPHQEQTDQPLGKELISCMKIAVPGKLHEAEASYRSMLQDWKSVTVDVSNNLREGVNRLNDRLDVHFNEMMRSVRSLSTLFSNSAPEARKWLPKSIDRLIDMCKGDVQHLLQETNTLIMTLGNFEKQLDSGELNLF